MFELSKKILNDSFKSVDSKQNYDELDTFAHKLKDLEKNRDDLIEKINYNIIHYNLNTLKNFYYKLVLLKHEISNILLNIDKLMKTHTIDIDSPNIKYITVTITRINDSVIFFMYLYEIAKKSKNINEFINIISRINEKSNEFIRIDTTKLNNSGTIINNVWVIIDNIDTLLRVQINNFNKTKKLLEEEYKLIYKKKELIIDLEHLHNKIDRESKIEDLIKTYNLSGVAEEPDVKDENILMTILDGQHKQIIQNKAVNITQTISIPIIEDIPELNISETLDVPCDFKTGDKVSKKGESKIGTVVSVERCDNAVVSYSGQTERVNIHITELDHLDEILAMLNTSEIEKRMTHSIKLYSNTINECNSLLQKEINKMIGINIARTQNINMLTDVKCQRSMFEMNLFSSKYAESLIRFGNKETKTIDGNVLDIIYEDGKTKLVVKTKLEDIITKELRYCKSQSYDENQRQKIILAEAELVKHAKKSGFIIQAPVICKKIVTPINEHWHKEKNVEIHGDIEKIIEINESGGTKEAGFILTNIKSAAGISLDPNEYPTKFSMNDCNLAYTITLNKLDEKKSKKYILKQLDKLKIVASQIDDLDVNLPDYDFKLKSLSKIYQHIKDDINNKIENKEPSFEDIKNQEKDLSIFKQEVEINNIKKHNDRLTRKRILLENMHKQRKVESSQKLKGGLNQIQHAGLPPNTPLTFIKNNNSTYFELKESINKVNLDSILLESKSLIDKFK